MLGDKIVRDRRERLQSTRCTEREAADILARPAPRSMTSESWPPTKGERERYAKARNPKAD